MLARLFVALAREDKKAVVKQYTEMGFRTRNMNEDIIFKHASVIFDRDDKEALGNTNIQQYLEGESFDPWSPQATRALTCVFTWGRS
jgi:predicted unusual protein kinase regulating ubiquinone biosynthesis (AarF/ABC1/UbiB family)